jgi:hypothetical protein
LYKGLKLSHANVRPSVDSPLMKLFIAITYCN